MRQSRNTSAHVGEGGGEERKRKADEIFGYAHQRPMTRQLRKET